MTDDADEAVAALCERLSLERVPPRLAEALTHPSYANEQAEVAGDYQRLEFLGDAVLELCVSEILMEAFPTVREGELTLMRAALVNTDALAAAARRVGLPEVMRLGRGAATAGERNRTSVQADVLEAVVGAVYLDRGLERARQLAASLLAKPLARMVARGGGDRDAKSRLQEVLQAEGHPPPSYEVVRVDGPPHEREFVVACIIDRGGEHRAEGVGRSKKLAQQAAAAALLDQLERPDDPGSDEAEADQEVDDA